MRELTLNEQAAVSGGEEELRQETVVVRGQRSGQRLAEDVYGWAHESQGFAATMGFLGGTLGFTQGGIGGGAAGAYLAGEYGDDAAATAALVLGTTTAVAVQIIDDPQGSIVGLVGDIPFAGSDTPFD